MKIILQSVIHATTKSELNFLKDGKVCLDAKKFQWKIVKDIRNYISQ